MFHFRIRQHLIKIQNSAGSRFGVKWVGIDTQKFIQECSLTQDDVIYVYSLYEAYSLFIIIK